MPLLPTRAKAKPDAPPADDAPPPPPASPPPLGLWPAGLSLDDYEPLRRAREQRVQLESRADDLRAEAERLDAEYRGNTVRAAAEALLAGGTLAETSAAAARAQTLRRDLAALEAAVNILDGRIRDELVPAARRHLAPLARPAYAAAVRAIERPLAELTAALAAYADVQERMRVADLGTFGCGFHGLRKFFETGASTNPRECTLLASWRAAARADGFID